MIDGVAETTSSTRVTIGAAVRPRTHVQLTGRSAEVTALEQEIDRVARSDAKVLITGESGVGKEIVARAIHSRGPRATHVFAPVNCAGLPETLLESELFGHVKGSFTGAYRDKPGKLETAHMGTIFLDEVGADGSGRIVNVRVIAATNRDLREMIKQGTFREDLFYRLNVIHIVVPPLRDRREDIPVLAHQFLTQFSAASRSGITGVSPEAMKALTEYSWPGNVRELENVIERLVVTVTGPMIEVDHLSSEIRSYDAVLLRPKRERRRTVADDLYKRMIEQHESFWTAVYPLFMDREITRANVREVVRRGLEEARGNYKIVARLFNMEARDYKRFLNFLRKHDCQIPFKEYR